ncbi:hypothetical protein [Xenorhabdus griffiniae]|uniref:Lipoprotein n=1 Tax=Xenorhabdus griffiniae TaxID=351672 RepID=A0ABY9XE67_9GAMM|nr:hypothetical protein [Xenorhabdus griffiniae]MBD1226107.1 hypothetical protein [Xenorhabdus griffiniae]MBE8586016.1 hypothetical protein [Xenorhabdus griffiniae]WMV71207.1 hypothetical protein QL128_13535 [Xenorhabdus griffiniae]WNH00883.1 hypothetical protein QL112_013540 [Xenorhabdus griffiniae]
MKKILLLSAAILSGCSTYGIPTNNLKSLNNNDLCKALGQQEFSIDTIHRIYEEIFSRAGQIDTDKCMQMVKETRSYELSRKRFSEFQFMSQQRELQMITDSIKNML